MKKILVIMLLAIMGMSSSSVFAQEIPNVTVTAEAAVDPTGGPVTRPLNPLQKLRGLLNQQKEIKSEARSATKTIRENKKEDLQDLKKSIASTTEKIKADKERMASSTLLKKENAARKISKKLQNMVDRIESTIEREEAIMAKINSRIGKIKAGGGETAEAERSVAEAKVHLEAAKTSLAALKLSIGVAISEENASTTASVTKDTQQSMKKAGSEIEKNLRDAHKALQKSVGLLKGMSQLKNASSTKETN